ncbi:MAG TPA: hypothetical protein VFF18_11040 [Woeseiaceae bacterium]|nr:hypothetical protein [Woeseiaceae bacterium]
MSPLTKHFQEAVLALAGHAPIKQRLVCAYSDHLSAVHDEDLPRRLLGRFSDLRRRLHSVTPLNGEGPVRASVRKMSGPEAADCAKIIVALYGELASWEAAAGTGPLHLVRAPELEDVPDFLLKS